MLLIDNLNSLHRILGLVEHIVATFLYIASLATYLGWTNFFLITAKTDPWQQKWSLSILFWNVS